MGALVTVRLPDGTRADLGPGDLIGRVTSAALVLDDPRISEAHALVSLRHGELYLLSLRRRIGLRGKPVSEVLLEPGVVVELAEGMPLTVERVEKPARVRALRARDLGVRPLGQVASVVAGPPLRLIGRFVPGAAAHLWSAGVDEWRLRIGEGATQTLTIGDTFIVGACLFEMCAVDLDAASHEPTVATGLDVPLRLVAHYDSVEIHRPNRPVVLIGGLGARLVSELVAFGGPVSWEVVARELWGQESDPAELRHRWDVALGRLRSRLRDAGIRSDLLKSDGVGQLQLLMYDGDCVDDRT
ncbi:FHA domain-containing protein [Myxococcota bacterium]|nr:FHA domain-containing protein [Myxococcota bacterium]